MCFCAGFLSGDVGGGGGEGSFIAGWRGSVPL